MADLATQQGSTLFSPQVLQLLQNAIGGTTDQNVVKTGTTSQNTTQAGESASTTAGSVTGTNNSTTQSTADISALQQVFAQQQAGITPEMLAAIFTEGSKAAPGLVAANANAVGARSSNNTPLATALTGLNSQLTSKAAELDLAQKNASAQTAAEIARLTGGSTTTGTTGQTSTQNQNQTGTQTTGQTGTSSDTTNNQTDVQPNYGNVTNLLGMLLGGQALNSGLAGIGGISGAVGAGTNAIGNLLQQVLGPLLGQGANAGTGLLPTPGQQDLTTDSLGGLEGFGGTTVTPGDQTVQGDALTGGPGLTAQPSLEQLLAQLGGSLGSSSQDSLASLLDSLGMGGGSGLTGMPDLTTGGSVLDTFTTPSWWEEEGWGSYDFGG